MKKQYEKPMMVIEHYALTQAIASCITKISFLDSECVLDDADATRQMKDLAMAGLFSTGCSISAEGMDGTDKICYHTNIAAAFTS